MSDFKSLKELYDNLSIFLSSDKAKKRLAVEFDIYATTQVLNYKKNFSKEICDWFENRCEKLVTDKNARAAILRNKKNGIFYGIGDKAERGRILALYDEADKTIKMYRLFSTESEHSEYEELIDNEIKQQKIINEDELFPLPIEEVIDNIYKNK